MEGDFRHRHNATVHADLETGFGPQVDHHQPPVDATFTTDRQVGRLHDRLSAYFSKATTMNILLAATFIGRMLYHSHAMTSVSAVAFGFLSLVILLINLFGLFSSGRGEPHVQRLCKIAYASTMLRMLATFTLLLFYEVVYYGVIAPLVLFLLLILWLLMKMTEDSLDHMIGATYYWEAHGTQLEFRFDISAEAVSMGFSGLCGAALGYVKNSLDLTRGHKSPECFLFYGTTVGLLVELLAAVPPAAYLEDRRRRIVAVYLPFLAYAAVLFLLMGCFAAAEAILHEHIFFAFLADVLVVVLCFWKNHTDDGTHLRWDGNRSDEAHKAELKRCRHLAVFHAAMFSVLIASYTTYVGKVDSSGSDLTSSLSWPFKCFVLAMLSSIVTYFTWIVVVLETPSLDSRAFPKQAWAWATYLLMAVSAIFVVLLLVGHRDELLSII